MTHKLDNLYQGLPVYVVSTGTSLRGFDFQRLNGKITIGINRIVEYYHPTILHFIDKTAHQTHEKALRNYNGMIICGEGAGPTVSHANVFEIKRNVDTFELSENVTSISKKVSRSFSDGLYGGGAGCTALHTAILLGGNPIYLLGYDFYEDDGRYFDEYDTSRNNKYLLGAYQIAFEGIEHLAREDWIPKIYNGNPRSRMTAFPSVDVDTILGGYSRAQKAG